MNKLIILLLFIPLISLGKTFSGSSTITFKEPVVHNYKNEII